MGATKQPKGRIGRRQRRQAPRRVQRRHGQPAPQGQAPPGAWFAPLPSAARVQPQGSCMARAVRAAGGSGQGCRGRSPRQNKLLVSPFPPGRGSGGWGQQSKLKAGAAGDKEGKPPAGYSGGKVSRHRKGQATPPGAGLHHPSPVPPEFSRRAPVRRGL